MAHDLSQHADYPMRVHRTDLLFKNLKRSIAELRPAIESLADQRLRVGASGSVDTFGSVSFLLDIFEFLTGAEAYRTYDDDSQDEVSPFSRFVESVYTTAYGANAPKTEKAVRSVLEDMIEERHSNKLTETSE